MKRIYCAIGKLVEVTQNIELNIIDIIEKSEIIKEFGRHAKITIEQQGGDIKVESTPNVGSTFTIMLKK